MPWVILIVFLFAVAALIDFIFKNPPALIVCVGLLFLGIYKLCEPSLERQRHEAKLRQEKLDQERELAEAQRDWSWPSKESFREQLLNAYEHSTRKLADQFLTSIVAGFVELYSQEFPTEFQPQHVVKTRDKNATFSLFLNTCSAALLDFTKLLPEEYMRPALASSLFTLSRPVFFVEEIKHDDPSKYQWIWQPKCWEACAALAKHFGNKTLLESRGLFNWSSYNIYGVFEDDDDDSSDRDRLTFEIPFRGTPLRPLVSRFLLFGTIEIPFEVPDENRFEGTWIVAPPRRGKTNLLHNLVAEDMKRGTVICIDSKGDLINPMRGLPCTIIDPRNVTINPLKLSTQTHSVAFVEYIFGALLATEMTAKQKTLFSEVLHLLSVIPDATMETFRDILTNGTAPYRGHIGKLKKMGQDFFAPKGEFDGPLYRETKTEVLWRLRNMLRNDYFYKMFTSPKTNIDFAKLMDSRGLIIIDNSKALLGEENQEFFARLFIAMIWMCAVQRSHLKPDQKVPVFVYIDECHTVIKRDDKIATILDECRSQKIALILAHQRIKQIESENVLDALTNCGIKIANSDADAPALAPRLHTEPDKLRLPQGSFALFARDVTPEAVTVSVPLFDSNRFPPAPDLGYEGAERASPIDDTEADQPQPPRSPPRTPQVREERPDDTLYWDITISPRKALKGGTHDLQIFADPSGRKKSINIDIPSGTHDGARFRLRGAGSFRPDGARGDIVLTIRVPTLPRHSQVSIFGSSDDLDEIG
jgi:hypothetical protein